MKNGEIILEDLVLEVSIPKDFKAQPYFIEKGPCISGICKTSYGKVFKREWYYRVYDESKKLLGVLKEYKNREEDNRISWSRELYAINGSNFLYHYETEKRWWELLWDIVKLDSKASTWKGQSITITDKNRIEDPHINKFLDEVLVVNPEAAVV